MNKINKIAQRATYYSNVWEVLQPEKHADMSPEENQAIDKIKNKFKPYLLNFMNKFKGDRKSFALRSLQQALQASSFGVDQPYTTAIDLAMDRFPGIIEETQKALEKRFNGDSGDQALDVSLEEPRQEWTVLQWDNTLGMLQLRAAYQYREAKSNANLATATEAQKKMYAAESKIKATYYAAVKALRAALQQIKTDRNLADTSVVKDEWLRAAGGRGGGRDNVEDRRKRYPDYPGSNNRRGPGREFPGGGQNNYATIRQQPFIRNGRGDFLYIVDLLEAFGLDSDPRYQILMDHDAAIPGRAWRSGSPNSAIETVGDDVELFKRYTQALHSALREILAGYNDEVRYSNLESDPKQLQLGRKYESSVRQMMSYYGVKPLGQAPPPRAEQKSEQNQETKKPNQRTYNEGSEENTSSEEWKASVKKFGEDEWVQKVSDRIEAKGYVWARREYPKIIPGWFKRNETGLINMFLSFENGQLYKATKPKANFESGMGWQKQDVENWKTLVEPETE